MATTHPIVSGDSGLPSRRPLSARRVAASVLLLIAVPAVLVVIAALNASSTGVPFLGTVPPKYLIAGALMAVGAASAVAVAGSFERGLFLLFVLSVPVRAVLRVGAMPPNIEALLAQWTGSGNPAWLGYPLGQLSIALSDLPLALLWIGALPRVLRRPPAFAWWTLSGAALFVLAELVSLTAASQPVLAWWAVVETAKAAAGAAYVVYRTRSREDFAFCLNAVSLALLLQAGLAVAQFLTSSTLGLTFAGSDAPQTFQGSDYIRSSGTFPHPQMLAMYVGMFFPLLVAAALLRQPIAARIGRALGVLAGSTALILTFSRMGWLASGVGVVLVIMATSVSRKHSRQAVRVGLVLLLALLVTMPLWGTIATNLTLERAGSELDIIADLYRVAFRMIAENPLHGVGINHFSLVMPQDDRTGIAMFYPAPVHNLFVLALAEMGPLGLIGLIAVIAVPASGLWRVRRRLDHEGRCIATGLLGGLLALSMLSLTGWTYYVIQPPVWLFLGMALAGASGGLGHRDALPHPMPSRAAVSTRERKIVPA